MQQRTRPSSRVILLFLIKVVKKYYMLTVTVSIIKQPNKHCPLRTVNYFVTLSEKYKCKQERQADSWTTFGSVYETTAHLRQQTTDCSHVSNQCTWKDLPNLTGNVQKDETLILRPQCGRMDRAEQQVQTGELEGAWRGPFTSSSEHTTKCAQCHSHHTLVSVFTWKMTLFAVLSHKMPRPSISQSLVWNKCRLWTNNFTPVCFM